MNDISDLGNSQTSELSFSKQSSEDQAFVNLLKSQIGIGVATISYAAYKTGYIWSIVLLIPIIYCTIKTTLYLVEVADHLHGRELIYNDVVRVVLNGQWASFVDLLIVLDCISMCIAYIIFFMTFVEIQLRQWDKDFPKAVYLAATLVLTLPLSMIQNIHFFHKWSRFGVVCSLLGLLVSIIYGWMKIFNGDEIHLEDPIKMEYSFQYTGMAILTFSPILTCLPIRDSMADRFVIYNPNSIYQKFKSVFNSAFLWFFILLVGFQLSSVITYGPELSPIIVFSIMNPMWQLLAGGLYSISLLISFPLMLCPVFQIMDNQIVQQSYSQLVREELIDLQVMDKQALWTSDLASITLRVSTVFVIYVTAYYVPDIHLFLNLVGCFLENVIQFIIPCILHWICFRNNPAMKQQWTYIVIMIISTLILFLGSYQSIWEMINFESIIH